MSAIVPDLEIQAAAHLLAEGRHDEAARILERLVDAAPAYAAGLVLLARAYDAQDRSGDALEAWHRAHFLVPTSPLVRRERQRLLDANATGADDAGEPRARQGIDSFGHDRFGAGSADGPSSAEIPEWGRDVEFDEPPSTDDVSLEGDLAQGLAEAGETISPIDSEWSDDLGEAETAADGSHVSTAADDTAAPGMSSHSPEIPDPAARIEDAPPAVEASPVDSEPAMDPFDWVITQDVDRQAVLEPAEESAGERARLFAEEAFAGEDASGGEAVFVEVSDEVPAAEDAGPVSRTDTIQEEEGWSLLDETDDRAEGPSEPTEARIAPPLGFGPPSPWTIVPSDEAARAGEEKTGGLGSATRDDDLDSLIRQIEDAPRIRPDPHFIPADDSEPSDVPVDDEDVVSETLALIYAAQHQFGEAASVYEKLAVQRPDQGEAFRQRASELRERAGRAGQR